MCAPQVDLLVRATADATAPPRLLGQVGHLRPSVQVAGKDLARWVQHSRADYLLLWGLGQPLPQTTPVLALIGTGLDLAHCGLMQGLGVVWPDLYLAIQDW